MKVRTTDLAERVFFLRLFLPCWAMTWLGLRMLLKGSALSRPTALLLMWVAAPLFAYVFAFLLNHALTRASQAVLGTLHSSSGGEKHSREYSEQQSLIVSGRIDDAIDSFQAHLVAFPDDVEARLRLAGLYAGPGKQPDAAVHQYLEARSMTLNPRQELVIGNALIDLYRHTGQRHALKAELARFARLHQGSEAGTQARQHLRQLVEEEHRVT